MLVVLFCFHRLEISKTFDCEVKITSEMEAIAHGLRFLNSHAEINSFIYLPEVVDPFSVTIKSRYIDKVRIKYDENNFILQILG